MSDGAVYAAQWLESIELGYWEGIIALTLKLTTKIRDLRLRCWSCENDGYPNRLRFVEGNPLSLSHVTNVRQEYWETNGMGMSVMTTTSFLSIPSVESFLVRMNEKQYDSIPHLSSIKKFPRMKDLDLIGASMAPASPV